MQFMILVFHTKYLPTQDCIANESKQIKACTVKDGRLLISQVLESDADFKDLDIIFRGLKSFQVKFKFLEQLLVIFLSRNRITPAS